MIPPTGTDIGTAERTEGGRASGLNDGAAMSTAKRSAQVLGTGADNDIGVHNGIYIVEGRFDGGYRNNSKHAATGFIIRIQGQIMHAGGTFIKGTCVDNEMAEVLACKRLLEVAIEKELFEMRIFGDNASVIEWCKREHVPTRNDLLTEMTIVHGLIARFKSIAFAHVHRINNREADAMCNVCLKLEKDVNGVDGIALLTSYMEEQKFWGKIQKRNIDYVEVCPIAGCGARFTGEDLRVFPEHLNDKHPGKVTIDTLKIPTTRRQGSGTERAHALHCANCHAIKLNFNGHKGCVGVDGTSAPQSLLNNVIGGTAGGFELVPDMLQDPQIGGLLDKVTMEEIFRVTGSITQPIMKYIPRRGMLQESFAVCFSRVITSINDIPDNTPNREVVEERGWKCLLLLASAVLRAPGGRGKKGHVVRMRLNWFAWGKWDKLIDVIRENVEKSPSYEVHEDNMEDYRNEKEVSDELPWSVQSRLMGFIAGGHISKAWSALQNARKPRTTISKTVWVDQAEQHFKKPYVGKLAWDPEDPAILDALKRAKDVALDRIEGVDWAKFIKSIPVVSAVTGEGYSASHLRDIWKYQPDSLVTLFTWITLGKVPARVKEWLFGARLVFIPKPGRIPPAYRPVGIGNIFVRVVSKCLSDVYKSDFAKILQPFGQVAVATPSGVDHYTMGLRLYMEHLLQNGRKPVALTVDLKHGFTNISRRRVFETLWGDDDDTHPLAGILPFFHAQYGQGGFQHSVEHGTWCRQTEGLGQGCPLSMALFCLASTPVVVERARRALGVDTIDDAAKATFGYADDYTLVIDEVCDVPHATRTMLEIDTENPDVVCEASKATVCTPD